MTTPDTILKSILDCIQADSGLFPDDLPEGFEEVEEGEWTQDHKNQDCTTIVWHENTNRYFAIHNSRQGSPFTDWFYSTPTVNEVAPHVETVTVTTWKAK